jgi:hypothetical protein
MFILLMSGYLNTVCEGNLSVPVTRNDYLDCLLVFDWD